MPVRSVRRPSSSRPRQKLPRPFLCPCRSGALHGARGLARRLHTPPHARAPACGTGAHARHGAQRAVGRRFHTAPRAAACGTGANARHGAPRASRANSTRLRRLRRARTAGERALPSFRRLLHVEAQSSVSGYALNGHAEFVTVERNALDTLGGQDQIL